MRSLEALTPAAAAAVPLPPFKRVYATAIQPRQLQTAWRALELGDKQDLLQAMVSCCAARHLYCLAGM